MIQQPPIDIDFIESASGPVQIFKASYALQRRVGKGPFDPAVLLKCQTVMDTVEVDYPTMAAVWLDALKMGIDRSKNTVLSMPDRIEFLSRPVMDLKSSGRMFRYDLVTELANIMLSFLELMHTLDDEVMDIISAHHDSLRTIMDRRVSGGGGQYGQMLRQELKDACGRYCRKHGLPPLVISAV